MSNYKSIKSDNSAFTLVELLVSLAISGIVIVMIALMMTNGTMLFRNERVKIDLQNELQAVDSFVTQTVMEAKTLDINNKSGQLDTLYTGVRDVDDALASLDGGALTTERIITYDPDNKSLYITKSYIANLTKGYLISGYVTEFKVSIDEDCKTYKEVVNPINNTVTYEHDGYSNPIILNVSVTITDGTKNKHKDMVITARNELSSVTVDGISYTVK